MLTKPARPSARRIELGGSRARSLEEKLPQTPGRGAHSYAAIAADERATDQMKALHEGPLNSEISDLLSPPGQASIVSKPLP